MLNKIITMKRIIDEDPKTPMKYWVTESGLTMQEVDYLRDNGHLVKLGDKKGARWVWKGDEPDYEFAESMKLNIYTSDTKKEMRVNNVDVTEDTTMLDVISAYDLSFKISNGITLKFINDSTVSLRKSNGKTITISDANKLNDMLCFLT